MEIEKKKKGIGKVKTLVDTRKFSVRGRKFEGVIIKKFDKRITIEFERVKLIRKYERYVKKRSKMHAYLPENMKDSVKIGDYVQIQESRPMSKILHHVVINKIRDKKNETN